MNSALQEKNILEEGLEKLGFEKLQFPENILAKKSRILELLEKYIAEIELFNEAYGLVKVNSRNELIVKHILDSIAPLKILLDIPWHEPSDPWSAVRSASVRDNFQIADVGSGAGLPGIPLAICLPNVEFTLIERMGRRAGFLRNCIAVLGLSNVYVEETEFEKAAPNRFDMVVFRAFRPLTREILGCLLKLLKPGAANLPCTLAAWKGRPVNAKEEMLSVEKSFPGLQWEVIPVAVPFIEEERCLTRISAGH